MSKQAEHKPWQQLVADKAMGVQRDPEERERLLVEARQAARPTGPGWARTIADAVAAEHQAKPPQAPAEGAEGQDWAEQAAARFHRPAAPPPDAA